MENMEVLSWRTFATRHDGSQVEPGYVTCTYASFLRKGVMYLLMCIEMVRQRCL